MVGVFSAYVFYIGVRLKRRVFLLGVGAVFVILFTLVLVLLKGCEGMQTHSVTLFSIAE